jgi:hypothetical protein
MPDKAEQKPCNCGGQGSTSGQRRPAREDVAKLVKGEVPQGYLANLEIELVPAHGLKTGAAVTVLPACKPRGYPVGWDSGNMTIDPALLATLNKADAAMVDWLARDTANAQRFLANPVAAMREAGVELSRVEEKALARASEAASAARFVGPGVKIGSLSVKADPNGRIEELGLGRTDGKTDDFGRGPEKKG